ncbi:very short patch repair endonuclease [Mesorhizobium sp. M0909]|uniref:very short patch repair endonuclease n=1 Tax=Mesorhizobium sp. M0909 TaxID=2957024 RepID=UPI00333501B0
MDTLTPKERSARMALIRSKDTHPEFVVRRLLHAAGYRFRLHVPGLPGKPDIVFSHRRKVVFVHGCFWHNHEDCPVGHVPKSRGEFWRAKFERTKERDRKNALALEALGWAVAVAWECETRDPLRLLETLAAFLGPPASANGPGAQTLPTLLSSGD